MNLTLGEFMTRDVKTLREDQVLLDALAFLHEQGVRHVPIMSGERLVGVLTDRDVKRASPSALAPGQREVWEKVVRETPLKKIMTRDPMTATSTTTLREALIRFTDDKIGCLPVVEGGRLVGIVTARDLFRAMLRVLAKA